MNNNDSPSTVNSVKFFIPLTTFFFSKSILYEQGYGAVFYRLSSLSDILSRALSHLDKIGRALYTNPCWFI